ncbi:MAG: acyloxyacyl hydrolase [Vicinamibacterales bacterium]
MRGSTLVAIALALTCASTALAQEPTEDQPSTGTLPEQSTLIHPAFFEVGTAELMVGGGPAFGIVLFHSAQGHRYALQTLSVGWIMSGPRGSGALRGRFEWAVEAVPVYGQFAPQTTYGFGLTPLVWRWNFVPQGKLAPYAELAGGALWTKDDVPARTTNSNFTAHAGAGVRIFLRPQDAVVVSYRLHHISNGNRLERNPGVNAHVFQVGWSYLRPRR